MRDYCVQGLVPVQYFPFNSVTFHCESLNKLLLCVQPQSSSSFTPCFIISASFSLRSPPLQILPHLIAAASLLGFLILSLSLSSCWSVIVNTRAALFQHGTDAQSQEFTHSCPKPAKYNDRASPLSFTWKTLACLSLITTHPTVLCYASVSSSVSFQPFFISTFQIFLTTAKTILGKQMKKHKQVFFISAGKHKSHFSVWIT